jgi:hypothetical protein
VSLEEEEIPVMYITTEERPCKDTAKRQLSENYKKASGENNTARTLILQVQPTKL